MREDVDEDLAVTSYATAQRCGDKTFQCDATAVFTAPDGTRAYALLDGVGDTEAVRSWTRAAAFLLARAAAGHADAEAGLRAEYGHYAADPARTAGHDLADYLTGTPRTAAAERLVDDAVRRAHELSDPYADNATALVARIT
jgi:hypothetical protein